MPVLEAMVGERTLIHALWCKQNHRAPKIKAFFDFLTDIYGAVPYGDQQTDKNHENYTAALRISL